MSIVEYIRTFTPDTWAVYVVGTVGFWVTIRQMKKSFQLKKKADTFEKLSKKIQEASEFSRQISSNADSIIREISGIADSMLFEEANKSASEISTELDRRIEVLKDLKSKQSQYVERISLNALNVLSIIKDIEKSTIVKEKTRIAARYLFYEAEDQYKLMEAANSILATIKVVPLLGEQPNVTPDTFKSIRHLVLIISDRNSVIGGYLDDLGIVLHNDLVSRIYGKAKNETIPARHLNHEGLRDNRTKKPLL